MDRIATSDSKLCTLEEINNHQKIVSIIVPCVIMTAMTLRVVTDQCSFFYDKASHCFVVNWWKRGL